MAYFMETNLGELLLLRFLFCFTLVIILQVLSTQPNIIQTLSSLPLLSTTMQQLLVKKQRRFLSRKTFATKQYQNRYDDREQQQHPLPPPSTIAIATIMTSSIFKVVWQRSIARLLSTSRMAAAATTAHRGWIPLLSNTCCPFHYSL